MGYIIFRLRWNGLTIWCEGLGREHATDQTFQTFHYYTMKYLHFNNLLPIKQYFKIFIFQNYVYRYYLSRIPFHPTIFDNK